MDDKFRLVIVWSGSTPSADAYRAPDARAYPTLKEAVEAGHARTVSDNVPFIAYKHMVFEPLLIDILYKQLVADTVTA